MACGYIPLMRNLHSGEIMSNMHIWNIKDDRSQGNTNNECFVEAKHCSDLYACNVCY